MHGLPVSMTSIMSRLFSMSDFFISRMKALYLMMVGSLLILGKVKGMPNPDGSRVGLGAGMGTGWLRRTRELQNEPKSARNGPELSKICSKYGRLRILSISCPKMVRFGRSWARFARKTCGYTGRLRHVCGSRSAISYPRVTCDVPYLYCMWYYLCIS